MNKTVAVDLAAINPVAIFTTDGLQDLLQAIEVEARALVPDVGTTKGRKAIASNAAKVARSKTYLDARGKELTADLRKQVKVIDAVRSVMRKQLDDLKVEVRKPLTDWEQQEARRQAVFRETIENMTGEMRILAGGVEEGAMPVSSKQIEEALARVEAVVIDASFEEYQREAQQTKDATLYQLGRQLMKTKEREAAEEARIKEAEAREAIIKRKAAEKAAEAARMEAEKAAEAARMEAEKAAEKAAEAARMEAEKAAEAARVEAKEIIERVEQAHKAELLRKEQARLDAIKAQQDAERRALEMYQRKLQETKDAEARAERQAKDAVRQERVRAESVRQAEEKKRVRREANQRHRATVNRAVLADLMALPTGLEEEVVRMIITAIVQKQVRHVTITY